MSGNITAVNANRQNPCSATFGAFTDRKDGKLKITSLYLADGQNSLFALNESGILRKWNIA
jgi:hypothetical protein